METKQETKLEEKQPQKDEGKTVLPEPLVLQKNQSEKIERDPEGLNEKGPREGERRREKRVNFFQWKMSHKIKNENYDKYEKHDKYNKYEKSEKYDRYEKYDKSESYGRGNYEDRHHKYSKGNDQYSQYDDQYKKTYEHRHYKNYNDYDNYNDNENYGSKYKYEKGPRNPLTISHYKSEGGTRKPGGYKSREQGGGYGANSGGYNVIYEVKKEKQGETNEGEKQQQKQYEPKKSYGEGQGQGDKRNDYSKVNLEIKRK